jgi:hypothetical protein
MKYIHFKDIYDLLGVISLCEEEGHNQQVAYSTHLKAITQVCFDCKKVRSQIEIKDTE